MSQIKKDRAAGVSDRWDEGSLCRELRLRSTDQHTKPQAFLLEYADEPPTDACGKKLHALLRRYFRAAWLVERTTKELEERRKTMEAAMRSVGRQRVTEAGRLALALDIVRLSAEEEREIQELRRRQRERHAEPAQTAAADDRFPLANPDEPGDRSLMDPHLLQLGPFREEE